MTEEESAAVVDEELALEAAREAFLAAASATTFPVVSAHGAEPTQTFALKSASSADFAGVKIGSFWPGNEELGLARHSSTVVLLDQQTGRVGAVVQTAAANAFRTAAADALAVEALARPDAEVLAVIGTGHQAFHEVGAVVRVRPIGRVLVVGRRAEAATAMADRLRAELGLSVETSEPERACSAADVVVTATTARQPLFEADWIRPGTHVSAMGADRAGKQELPTELYDRARLFCDLPEQSRRIGEFQHAPEGASLTALGDVLADPAQGRRDPDEITVFDSSGMALQDLTLAAALLRRHGSG